jgi:hypothetical protein
MTLQLMSRLLLASYGLMNWCGCVAKPLPLVLTAFAAAIAAAAAAATLPPLLLLLLLLLPPPLLSLLLLRQASRRLALMCACATLVQQCRR